MDDTHDLSSSLPSGELDSIRSSLDAINFSAERVSRSLSRTFANAIAGGRSFDETLRSVALNMSRLALNAGLQPLMQGATSSIGSALSSLAGGAGGPAVAPFADGGIVSRPTFFGMSSGLGLMGERGAEAILPLARGPDGRLGVTANAGMAKPQSINVVISTPDAKSFRRSQIEVAGALARAVARGQRAL